MAAFFFAILRGKSANGRARRDGKILFSRRKSMLQKAKHLTKRLSAFLLAVLVTASTCLSGSLPVHAADGTIQYRLDPRLIMEAILLPE